MAYLFDSNEDADAIQAQIEANKKRIAELRTRKQEIDGYKDTNDPMYKMGVFDWVYGGNANTFNSYLSNKRAGEQNRLMQEQNEQTRKASDISTLQNAIKTNAIDLEANAYDLRKAENAWKVLQNQPDSMDKRTAQIEYERIVAKQRRLENERDGLAKKQREILGITDDDVAEVQPQSQPREPTRQPLSMGATEASEAPAPTPSENGNASVIAELEPMLAQVTASETAIGKSAKSATLKKFDKLASAYDAMSKDESLPVEQRNEYATKAKEIRAAKKSYDKSQRTIEGNKAADDKTVADVGAMGFARQRQWVLKNKDLAKRLQGRIKWQTQDGKTAYDDAYGK